ncbi:MAG: hypothetical protein R2939_09145 [Kofleriaceae bacterium]
MKRADPDDAWYQAEVPLRREVMAELGRLARRARLRWRPTLVIALLVTALGAAFLARRPARHDASVTLALAEGQLATRASSLMRTELQAYVANVLLPDAALLEVVERHDLTPLRRTLGPQYAIAELRDALEVEVMRNTFLYDRDDSRRSARVQLTVTDADPELATTLAHDLAGVVIASATRPDPPDAAIWRPSAAVALDQVSDQVAALDALDRAAAAVDAADPSLSPLRRRCCADALLAREQEGAAAAEELEPRWPDRLRRQDHGGRQRRRPRPAGGGGGRGRHHVRSTPGPAPPTSRILLGLALVATVGVGLLLATFDDRVREPGDVTRAGLPVLGALPGFEERALRGRIPARPRRRPRSCTILSRRRDVDDHRHHPA